MRSTSLGTPGDRRARPRPSLPHCRRARRARRPAAHPRSPSSGPSRHLSRLRARDHPVRRASRAGRLGAGGRDRRGRRCGSTGCRTPTGAATLHRRPARVTRSRSSSSDGSEPPRHTPCTCCRQGFPTPVGAPRPALRCRPGNIALTLDRYDRVSRRATRRSWTATASRSTRARTASGSLDLKMAPAAIHRPSTHDHARIAAVARSSCSTTSTARLRRIETTGLVDTDDHDSAAAARRIALADRLRAQRRRPASWTRSSSTSRPTARSSSSGRARRTPTRRVDPGQRGLRPHQLDRRRSRTATSSRPSGT